MAIDPRAGILDIQPYKPGAADAPGVANPAKLSSNENALGCSLKAAKAFETAASRLHRYPDGGATRLRDAIAREEGIDADNIVCGTGSDEILQLLGRAYLNPGDKRGYTTDVDAVIAAAGDDTRIVFIANPNNPTGTYISEAEIRRLRDALPPTTLLVIDAAYTEFVDAEDYDSGMALARERDDVIVTRTFSKIHGLAGLRLGWGYGSKAIIDVLNRVRGPFNVNLPAIEAGAAAIADRDFMERSARHNAVWVDFLRQQIGGLGLEVTPSVCNFVLVHFPQTAGKTAADADAFLTRNGLIVRGVAPYGLPDALRITVGKEAENRRLVDALSEFMAR